ncbi:MAG: hypothetical protein ACKPKO_10680, partial [Candidatus Fonsibacter sp.]
FQSLAATGSTTKPTIPAVAGVYIGMESTTLASIEICASQFQYIDFTSPRVDFKGRIIYGIGPNDFQFLINSSSTAKMTLNSSGLSVGGTFVSASDKRLKFQRAATN